MTHCFEPGPRALTLGLRALVQLYPVQRAIRLAGDLLEDPSHGAFVAVWTDFGPTVIQYQGAETYLDVGLHIGTVMSMVHSGAGRFFAAFLPQQKLEHMLGREVAKSQGPAVANVHDDLNRLAADIRHTLLSRTQGVPIPGVDSLSAPVFDHAGQIVLSITLFGPSDKLDASAQGTLAKELLRVSDKLSVRKPEKASSVRRGGKRHWQREARRVRAQTEALATPYRNVRRTGGSRRQRNKRVDSNQEE
ncbi:UNVERIFIED_ORG: DNA-binding IclR family transcriptional regulator [Burkholderia sp. CF145]